MKSPLPPDETQRLDELRRYDVDTLPEHAFDDFALIAAHICQTSMAAVSIIGEKRQWFKSTVGLSITETSREASFCAHTILNKNEVMEVRDAGGDLRFADIELVTSDPSIRFYAGAPLVTPEGHALGALCVMDRTPHSLAPEQLTALRALSRNVVAQLELRRNTHKLANEFAEHQRAEALLRQQCYQLEMNGQETAHQLANAERSCSTLQGVLEHEKRTVQKLRESEDRTRRQAEMALRESEERFREIAENITEVFWVTDWESGKVLYLSPAYEKIWGRTCESLYRSPENWNDATHRDDQKRVKEAFASLAHQKGFDEIYRIVRPDGSVCWIHDRGSAIRNAEGKICRLVGIAEDITQEHKLEDRIRQAQKMDAMGTLAGGIAHDFNNILSAMIGYAELAKMASKDNAHVREYLDTVLSAGARAVGLVRQILTFSRQQEQKREPVQLADVVAESFKLLRATIPSTIEFKMDLAAGVPNVLADPTQVHQVLMNLGTNAWHAMRNQPGRLDIKLEPFEVDTHLAELHARLRPGLYARVTVSDSGCGMDKATLDRIFEPFFTTKPQGEGTGLGLAMVHGIMQSNEGAITVYSQPGEGTTFHLYFPVSIGETAKIASTSMLLPKGNGERILYLDDEEALARLGQKALEQLGYMVEMQSNVMDALDLVRADPQRFDLIITDQTMPRMTGVDFARELLELRPSLPIILTTGYFASLTREQVRAMGIRELLPKPHTIHSLATTVHRVLTADESPLQKSA